MKYQFFSFLLLILFSACGQNENAKQDAPASNELKSEISSLESQLLETGDASKNQEAAKLLVEKTEEFAKANPEDEQTPAMLFKAADVANGARNYGKAIQLWGLVWRKHPDYENAPMALFLQGFTFDSKLQDAKMAQKYYKNFLKTYPNDSLATKVKQLLAVVEVPPEQLIKQFQETQ